MPSTILFLHSSAGRYGADLQLLALASGLDPARYRPLVVVPEGGELCALLEEAGVETVVQPLGVLRRSRLGPRSVSATAVQLALDRRRLGALARERRIRLVHSNTSVVLGGQAVADAAGAAHVVHVRELYSGAARRAWPLLRRRLLRADRLLCVSSAVAGQFAGESRAVVVHDCLARSPEPSPRDGARAALDLPGDPFVAALLGRISDWKGHDVLARALAEQPLAEIGAIGLVAGEAFPGAEHHERRLLGLASDLGLGTRLRLLGFRDDVETVLGAADAVAVPSTRPDPFPNSALEAAAAGLPLVAADHGGLPEIVRASGTGLLVPPGDPPALAGALRSIADDREGAVRRAAEAASRMRSRFSSERMLAEVQAHYDGLLESGTAGR